MKNSVIVLGLLTLGISAAPIKIMHVGARITEGESSETSYRRHIDAPLRALGHEVEFVGDSTRHNNGTVEPDSTFDFDHEAVFGSLSYDFHIRIAGLVEKHAPDVLVVYFGEEDQLYGGGADDEIALRVMFDTNLLIDSARTVNPNIKIIISNNIPTTNPIIPFRIHAIEAMNLILPHSVLYKSKSESPVLMADVFTGFDTTADLSADGTRPNASGAQKMAVVYTHMLDNIITGRGCTDPAYLDYNPAATESDPADCKILRTTRLAYKNKGPLFNSQSQEVQGFYDLKGRYIRQLAGNTRIPTGLYILRHPGQSVTKFLIH